LGADKKYGKHVPHETLPHIFCTVSPNQRLATPLSQLIVTVVRLARHVWRIFLCCWKECNTWHTFEGLSEFFFQSMWGGL